MSRENDLRRETGHIDGAIQSGDPRGKGQGTHQGDAFG